MLHLAAVQMRPAPMEPEENLLRIQRWMERCAEAGVQLAVFPECAVPGYFLTREEAERVAEPVPGPRSRALSEACARCGLSAVVGTIERGTDGSLYNAAMLLTADRQVTLYRKTHLLCLGVDRYLRRGEHLAPVVSAAGARLGLLICYDLRFPEPMRSLALDGAQVVLLPTAWPASAAFYADYLARARALENGVYLVAANRAAEERGHAFLGRSLIVGPDGEILSRADGDEEAMLVAEIDPSRSDVKHRVFEPGEYEVDLTADRRPELYGRLTER
ncbi:MAG TPA: carbon-nitrogen hydrolase family protein [Anaerolineales bacterium]|nr:carbon-nitrogen hydrolase family protein [Anaerolineales bacterium]